MLSRETEVNPFLHLLPPFSLMEELESGVGDRGCGRGCSEIIGNSCRVGGSGGGQILQRVSHLNTETSTFR